MSMDAGGLAQMTFSSFNGDSLGVPGSGFASRGKGSQLKRLSLPQPRQFSTIEASQPSATVATPRTSRSHLLAGLRTAPKSATLPLQSQQRLGPESGRFPLQSHRNAERIPQTASAATFPQFAYGTNLNPPSASYNVGMNANHRPLYSLPEQVLAPPAIDLGDGEVMDEKLYTELMTTNLFLAAQQQRLQQQLINVTAAAQQFQNLNLGVSVGGQQQQQHQSQPQPPPPHTPFVPGMSLYQQQLQQGMQPIVQPVAGQPGLYSVYNPMTGQHSLVVDNSIQQSDSPPPAYQEHVQSSTINPPPFRAEVSPPPPEPVETVAPSSRSVSPPKDNSSPSSDVEPLPPPSANAFRRGHKKSGSLLPNLRTNTDTARNGLTAPRTAGFPQTPLTGTFGPGQGRAGEHPIRQPRGPPSLEELVAKPTSKHEGSKNFATRQRRRAVHNLVRAGIERRAESRSLGSGGTNTPASESEFVLSGSDGDNCSRRSGSLSSKPSLTSLRAVPNAPIGSEMKDRPSRDCASVDSLYSAGNGDTLIEQAYPPIGAPSAAAIVAGHRSASQSLERRKAAMLVLSSAEKRKTPVM